MEIKLVIFDLDGTAIQPKITARPSQRLINAVKKAKSNATITLATGRSIETAKHIIRDLDITAPCILSGGTSIFDPVKNKFLWQELISYETLKEVKNTAFSQSILLNFENENPSKINNVNINESGIDIIYAMGITKENSESFCKELETIPEINSYVLPSWEIGKLDIHITSSKANKKVAAEKLMSILNISKANTLAVGDSENDIPLFEACGSKIAMGNASKKLIALADSIAPSISEDGLAWVLENTVI